MTDDFEKSPLPQTSDYVKADIGENASNVIVGKDINFIQIAGIKLPKWLAGFLPFMLILSLGAYTLSTVRELLPGFSPKDPAGAIQESAENTPSSTEPSISLPTTTSMFVTPTKPLSIANTIIPTEIPIEPMVTTPASMIHRLQITGTGTITDIVWGWKDTTLPIKINEIRYIGPDDPNLYTFTDCAGDEVSLKLEIQFKLDTDRVSASGQAQYFEDSDPLTECKGSVVATSNFEFILHPNMPYLLEIGPDKLGNSRGEIDIKLQFFME